MIILSVLIPTIAGRISKFKELYKQLSIQKTNLERDHPTLGEVEIIVDDSAPFLEGGVSIGAKRNNLVKAAKGKYLCFLDDDDEPAPNYLETLVKMCQPVANLFTYDCVTFNTIFKCDTYWTILDMSIHNKGDEEARPGSIVRRQAWHINPIRADIARQFEFGNKNHGEEVDFLNEVRKHLKNENHTDMILTQYNHSGKDSEADKILNYQIVKESDLKDFKH